MGWGLAGVLLGLLVGAVMGMRYGWQLATRSMEVMKRAQDQRPELRTLCGQHDAYLDIAQEIERSMTLPPDHTLKRVASYARSRAVQLVRQAERVGKEGLERLAASRGQTR